MLVRFYLDSTDESNATTRFSQIACSVYNSLVSSSSSCGEETANSYMRLALQQAEIAMQAGEVPVGAVVVLDGIVIGAGGNSTRSRRSVAAHAELCALEQAEQHLGDFRLDGAELYVTAEPCLMCLGAIHQARIGKLVFGCLEPKFGALYSRFALADHPAFRKLQVVQGVLSNDAAVLLKKFFKGLRTD